MTNGKTRSVILTLLMITSVFGGAVAFSGGAVASETTTIDNSTLNSTDQTNNTRIPVDGVGNLTFVANEDHPITAGGSIFLPMNVSAADANITNSTGSGTLVVNPVDDGIYVNETGGSSSATLSQLAVTVNFTDNVTNSTGSVVDAINTSEVTNKTQLFTDDDGSETQYYTVVAPSDYLNIEYKVNGPGQLNTTSMTYEVNESHVGERTQFVMTATRNGTPNANITLQDPIWFNVTLNKTGFSNISQTTNVSKEKIKLGAAPETSNTLTFAYQLRFQNNTSKTYPVKVNATIESADTNSSLSHEVNADPKGGLPMTASAAFAMDTAGAGDALGPDFSNLGTGTILAGLIGVVIVGGILYFLFRDQTPGQSGPTRYLAYQGVPMIGWLLVLVAAVTMALEGLMVLFTGMSGVFWIPALKGLVGVVAAGATVPGWVPLAIGIALAVGTLYLNKRHTAALV